MTINERVASAAPAASAVTRMSRPSISSTLPWSPISALRPVGNAASSAGETVPVVAGPPSVAVAVAVGVGVGVGVSVSLWGG